MVVPGVTGLTTGLRAWVIGIHSGGLWPEDENGEPPPVPGSQTRRGLKWVSSVAVSRSLRGRARGDTPASEVAVPA
jgi:hypothetical protein